MKHKKRKVVWRYFAKALGAKATHSDKESDVIALIRAVIFFSYLITNCFIIAGVIRHWNDEVPSTIPETQKETSLLTTEGSIL